MFGKFKIAALSALLSLGTLAAVPTGAQADGFYFSFGQNGPSVGFHHRGDDRGRFERHHRRHDRHHRWRHRDHWERASACTPRDAVRKAYRMGLHRVSVADVDRRTIRVHGRKGWRFATVIFARAPHCPVLHAL